MNKNPQTLEDLVELIKDKNFRPTCEELSELIDKVVENQKQEIKVKRKTR